MAELPNLLNLEGIVLNVDKILYIRDSCTEKDCFVTLQTGNSTEEIKVTGYTSNDIFTLIYKYNSLLRKERIK